MVCLFSIYKLKQYETIEGDCMKIARIIYSKSGPKKTPSKDWRQKIHGNFEMIMKGLSQTM